MIRQPDSSNLLRINAVQSILVDKICIIQWVEIISKLAWLLVQLNKYQTDLQPGSSMTSLVCSDPSKMVCSDPPRMVCSDPSTILEGSLQTKDIIDGPGCMRAAAREAANFSAVIRPFSQSSYILRMPQSFAKSPTII